MRLGVWERGLAGVSFGFDTEEMFDMKSNIETRIICVNLMAPEVCDRIVKSSKKQIEESLCPFQA